MVGIILIGIKLIGINMAFTIAVDTNLSNMNHIQLISRLRFLIYSQEQNIKW